MRSLLVFFLSSVSVFGLDCARKTAHESGATATFLTGADQPGQYLPYLKGHHVAVVANQTSVLDSPRVHLVDFLLQNGVSVDLVFAPEHGFRGDAGAGDKIQDGRDLKTGVRVVSLYGKKSKPSGEDLQGIDVVVFDIQDVGVRFYTYISTLHYVLEAAAEHNKPVVLLDRPNPNGDRIDGPVLDTSLTSFVGISPIPILHGLTVGEFARMTIGEKWIKSADKCSLMVVRMAGYSHSMPYTLPIPPSPNLRTSNAVRLYPSLCLFEGTVTSIGRGTDFPFEVYGYPGYSAGNIEFRPEDRPGVASHPPFEGVLCAGRDLRNAHHVEDEKQLDLSYLIDAYSKWPEPSRFFTDFFEKLAGTTELRKQIQSGMSEKDIRASWKGSLTAYKALRKKYLIYQE